MNPQGHIDSSVPSERIQPAWDIEAGGATRKGCARAVDEDCFVIGTSRPVIVMCDGMGGAPNGLLAARVASNVAIDTYEQHVNLPSAVICAGEAVTRLGSWLRTPEMGTTILAAAVEGDAFSMAWLGDTVAFLVRDRLLTQLTAPDRFPNSCGITKFVGSGQTCTPWESAFYPMDGDIVIMCTDGVWDYIPASHLSTIAARTDLTPQEMADFIVHNLACRSLDDASAVVIRIGMVASTT